MCKKNNFSLIELLVVIAIIGILASFLLPTLKKSRDTARAIVCVSNLKQMHIAETMWGQDDGTYMIPTNWDKSWTNSLIEYLGPKTTSGSHVLDCPALDDQSYRYGYSKYAGKKSLFDSRGATFDRVQRTGVRKPSNALLFLDSNLTDYSWDVLNEDKYSRMLHKGGSNLIFIDGHVKTSVFSKQEIADSNDTTYWFKWSWE